MPAVPQHILDLDQALYHTPEYADAEQALRTACTRLEMSRTGVLMQYGDPRTWTTTPWQQLLEHVAKELGT